MLSVNIIIVQHNRNVLLGVCVYFSVINYYTGRYLFYFINNNKYSSTRKNTTYFVGLLINLLTSFSASKYHVLLL